MPLNSILARKLISGAQAYSRHPGGDYIQALAKELTEALALIDEHARAMSREQGKSTVLQRELDAEREAYRKLRESSEGITVAIEVLKDIASSQKGGKAKAVAGLEKLGVVIEKPAAPTPVQEVAK